MLSLFLRVMVAACVLSFSQNAASDPFRIQDLKRVLQDNQFEGVDNAILYGQPILTGRIDDLGFTIGLRGCARYQNEDIYCSVAAFKSCASIETSRPRLDLLELVNAYNLSRRKGYIVLDSKNGFSHLFCVQHESEFGDENNIDFDEALLWEHIVSDFRSFLDEQEVELTDPAEL